MKIKTAIFLGAGASKADGAPLQNELFKEYFSCDSFKNSHDEMDRELATFFLYMFGIDVDNENLDNTVFPTFEEVLGLTDLAIMRKESFKEFDIENRASNSGRLRFIAQYLVFLVAKILEEKLKDKRVHHDKLVKNLLNIKALKETAFLSTNYDILIDNSLTELYSKNIDLNYGIDFENFNRKNDWRKPKDGRKVYLFKPHGSLNWLYCPACNYIEITPKEKGVVTRLITDFRNSTCKTCQNVYMPVIVPPTFYKDLNNVFLSIIWNKSENVLRKAEHIIFCGYSLPDSDMHIKYLLKRIQTNRNSKLKITVVNHCPGKLKNICNDEKYRFERFFGKGVNYTSKSFEYFANDPSNFM